MLANTLPKFAHFVQALKVLSWSAVKILHLTVQVLPTNPSPHTPPIVCWEVAIGWQYETPRPHAL